MPQDKSDVRFLKLRIFWLRLRTHIAARRVAALRRRTQRNSVLRRWPYVAGLIFCFSAAVSAIVVSALAQGMPVLHQLDGSLPSVDDVVILDPNRRDETLLAQGYLYDRPVAAMQTGFEPVLLRMRLEETLLAPALKDDGSRIIVEKFTANPGDNWEPHTISQDEALQLMQDGGFCKTADSWEKALESKLPARRLPNGFNDGGRLLIFESKAVIADPDSPIPDISVLLPEHIEAYNLGKAVYSYMGFYYINDNGTARYQPLHITVDSTAPRAVSASPPELTDISYEFYEWQVTQATIHLFGEETGSPVNLQLGENMRPITEWTKPEDAWFYDANGWVYYGQALTAGTMTPLLLNSFTVWPDSPLVSSEIRYRLYVRVQSTPLIHEQILLLWNSGAPLDGLGGNYLTNEAAAFAQGMLTLNS